MRLSAAQQRAINLTKAADYRRAMAQEAIDAPLRDKVARAWALMQAGDIEGAKAILSEGQPASA